MKQYNPRLRKGDSMKKGRRKKSLVGWASAGWNLYRGVVHIGHWDIFRVRVDAPATNVKVRITIEEL